MPAQPPVLGVPQPDWYRLKRARYSDARFGEFRIDRRSGEAVLSACATPR